MRSLKVVLVMVAVSLLAFGCGKKSALEGKVVDGQSQPISGLKVIAKQVQPIKGYEQFETTTGSDGAFRFGKLFPTSEYVLKPWSDKWTAEDAALKVESGPDGEAGTGIPTAAKSCGQDSLHPQTIGFSFRIHTSAS